MLDKYGSMIRNDILESFDKAVDDPNNKSSNGSMNWDWVAADVHMDLGNFYCAQHLNDCVDTLIENYFQ